MMNALLSPRLESVLKNDFNQQRHDEKSSAVVERGITVQASFNTICAIEYMKSHNVAPQVIERVLLHPEQRRKEHH
ncbi:hypothetical protein NHH82_14530 [Oxalobacteraceae bacterium OTU3REALA1]|nr:hypothetical protein NHH82_14530 [Oxalobacteraceae bacterium OTU3REALA1]